MHSALEAVDPTEAPEPAIAEARRSAVVRGPILAAIFKLGAPTMLVLLVQTLVGITETWYVSFLGTDALAGVSLVFPVLMLMTMAANGGFGGGVAQEVARAKGAGNRARVDALAYHAVIVAIALGAIFSAAVIFGGPALYTALGGEGQSLSAALGYSNFIFAGAVATWINALLAASLRGAGDVRMPAIVTLASSAFTLSISPLFIFGIGPFPKLGTSGAGLGVLFFSAGSAMFLILYMRSRSSPVRLAIGPVNWRTIRDIVGVGGLAAIGAAQANITVALITGAVGAYGAAAIAGFGIASRLDYFLIPILFGIGSSIITIVGTAIGAGDAARARRAAWTGAAVGGGVAGSIGFLAAAAPHIWTGIFTSEPDVSQIANDYLHVVGPTYVAFGAGLMLFFASVAAKQVLLPVLSGSARLCLAGLFGYWAAHQLDITIGTLFFVVAASSILFGMGCVAAVARVRWHGTANPNLR